MPALHSAARQAGQNSACRQCVPQSSHGERLSATVRTASTTRPTSKKATYARMNHPILCISSMLPFTPAQHRGLASLRLVRRRVFLLASGRTISERVLHGQVVVEVHGERHHDPVADGRRLRSRTRSRSSRSSRRSSSSSRSRSRSSSRAMSTARSSQARSVRASCVSLRAPQSRTARPAPPPARRLCCSPAPSLWEASRSIPMLLCSSAPAGLSGC